MQQKDDESTLKVLNDFMAEDPCAIEPEDLACSKCARFVLRVHTHRLSLDSGLSGLLFQPLGAVRKQKLNGCKHAQNVRIPMLTAH